VSRLTSGSPNIEAASTLVIREMTREEIVAFNKGVRAALDHAKLSAEALSADPAWLSTRVPFAVAALDEFAEAGEMLFLPLSPDDPGRSRS
jgi:hypothetical protein